MKIPIEFINSDSNSNKLYSLLSDIAAQKSPIDQTLAVEFGCRTAKFGNVAVLNLLTRSKNMVKFLLELEGALKQKEYEITRLKKKDYQIFDLVPMDDILGSIKQVELLRDTLNSKINSIFVTVLNFSNYIKYLEKSTTNYSYDLTEEVARLEKLEALLRSVDSTKYEEKLKILEEIVEELENLLNFYLQTDVYAIAGYHTAILTKVTKIVNELNEFLSELEARYQILHGIFTLLSKDLTDLLVRAEFLYQQIIDGAYVRSGNNVTIENAPGLEAGFFVVSASKPKITACAPLNPWYEAADIIIEKKTIECPEQPINSPLHPDFDPDPLGNNNNNYYYNKTTLSPSPSISPSISPSTSPSKQNLTLINCNPDLKYWSLENSAHEYVKRLTSNGESLNPSDPDQFDAARDYWKNNEPKIEINDTNSFYYGISAAMKMQNYKKLIVGNQNMLANGATAFNNTVSDYYKCLYQLFKTSLSSNSLGPSFSDWETFKKEAAIAKPSLGQYSKKQLLSFYLTYRWQTVCDVQDGFDSFVNDDAKIEQVSSTLSGEKHACQRISFCEAEPDDSLLGYAMQINRANIRVVNIEPGAQSFDCDAASPMIFGKGQFRCVKFSSGASGQQQVTGGGYFAVEKVGETDSTIADSIKSNASTQLMYTLIHESAHSIDYVKGFGTGLMGFSIQTGWTSISGWKKSGNNWIFDKPFKYPSELSPSDLEPPCTIYGHAFPWEDFAEAWTYFVLNQASFKKWYPKKHAFMQNNVVPFLNNIRR